MADDDVQLTDLEVIQQFSLAVRGATASRAEVRAALEADLAFLNGNRGRPAAPVATRALAAPDTAATKTVTAAPGKAPVRAAKAPLRTAKVTPTPRATPAKAKKAVKVPAKKATRGRSA